MTRREHQPLDYDPRLDRRQPPSLGCVGIVLALVLLAAALVPVAWGINFTLSKQQRAASASIPTLAALPSITPTATASPTALATVTLDDWSIYGTEIALATASPTPDYCWFLTPSPTPLPTLPYTPDAWQLQGTAIFLTENPQPSPTALPPRELCTGIPTWTPTMEATATFTPWPLPQLRESNLDAVQATIEAAFGTPTPAAYTIVAPPVREIYRDVYIIVTATQSAP